MALILLVSKGNDRHSRFVFSTFYRADIEAAYNHETRVTRKYADNMQIVSHIIANVLISTIIILSPEHVERETLLSILHIFCRERFRLHGGKPPAGFRLLRAFGNRRMLFTGFP
jgi:hypothetical protein